MEYVQKTQVAKMISLRGEPQKVRWDKRGRRALHVNACKEHIPKKEQSKWILVGFFCIFGLSDCLEQKQDCVQVVVVKCVSEQPAAAAVGDQHSLRERGRATQGTQTDYRGRISLFLSFHRPGTDRGGGRSGRCTRQCERRQEGRRAGERQRKDEPER